MCVDILSKLERGFLPLEIFNQVARLTRLPTVVVVPIRKEETKLEISLIKRDENDLWWPNKFHLPGTVFRSTDTIEEAINRVLINELEIISSDTPIYIDYIENQTTRGADVVFIHFVENCVFKDTAEVSWFSIDNLPENIVESEIIVINTLVEDYNSKSEF